MLKMPKCILNSLYGVIHCIIHALLLQGIAEMAGQEEGSQYEFLEISDPNSLLVRGEREEVNMEDCNELARIQALYVIFFTCSEWSKGHVYIMPLMA